MWQCRFLGAQHCLLFLLCTRNILLSQQSLPSKSQFVARMESAKMYEMHVLILDNWEVVFRYLFSSTFINNIKSIFLILYHFNWFISHFISFLSESFCLLYILIILYCHGVYTLIISNTFIKARLAWWIKGISFCWVFRLFKFIYLLFYLLAFCWLIVERWKFHKWTYCAHATWTVNNFSHWNPSNFVWSWLLRNNFFLLFLLWECFSCLKLCILLCFLISLL